MRESLIRAEKTLAEAEAKIELLQKLEQVKQESNQAISNSSQPERDIDGEQKESPKKISWHDLFSKTLNEEEDKKKQAQKRAELKHKAIMEAKRQAIDEMRQLQEKVKVDDEVPEGSTSSKSSRFGGFFKR